MVSQESKIFISDILNEFLVFLHGWSEFWEDFLSFLTEFLFSILVLIKKVFNGSIMLSFVHVASTVIQAWISEVFRSEAVAIEASVTAVSSSYLRWVNQLKVCLVERGEVLSEVQVDLGNSSLVGSAQVLVELSSDLSLWLLIVLYVFIVVVDEVAELYIIKGDVNIIVSEGEVQVSIQTDLVVESLKSLSLDGVNISCKWEMLLS